MTYSIDERNWEAYRQRALKEDRFPKLGGMKKQFRQAHRLMEKMIENDYDEKILVSSMMAFNSFLNWVRDRSGITAVASNFIICKGDEYEKES